MYKRQAYDLTDEPLDLTAGEYAFHLSNEVDKVSGSNLLTIINGVGLKYYNPLSVEASDPTVYLGTDAIVPFTVKMEGADVAFADLTSFEAKSSDDSTVTVKSIDADGIVLSGVKTGSAKLTINAEYNGEKTVKELNITVKEPAVEISAKLPIIYIENDTTVPVTFSKGGVEIAFSALSDVKAESSDTETLTVKSMTADGLTCLLYTSFGKNCRDTALRSIFMIQSAARTTT